MFLFKILWSYVFLVHLSYNVTNTWFSKSYLFHDFHFPMSNFSCNNFERSIDKKVSVITNQYISREIKLFLWEVQKCCFSKNDKLYLIMVIVNKINRFCVYFISSLLSIHISYADKRLNVITYGFFLLNLQAVLRPFRRLRSLLLDSNSQCLWLWKWKTIHLTAVIVIVKGIEL